MNRPGTNSLNQDLHDELYETLRRTEEQNDIKTVVLTSRLPFGFSSGLDLGSFKGDHPVFAEKVYNAVHRSFQTVKIIARSQKIFIAALAGPVIGSAASIAFSCDFRIAAPGTWFWLPDPQYGGFLADGGIELLTGLAGNSRSLRLALMNEHIDLDEADAWGLICKIAERRKLEDTALAAADRLCGLSFQTLGLHKKIINENTVGRFRGEELKTLLRSEETYEKFRSYTNPD